MSVRPGLRSDVPHIERLATATGLFADGETAWVSETLTGSLDGSMPGHAWVMYVNADGEPVGAAYYAPEPFADRVWNLYFLAVDPDRHGQGIGAELVERVRGALVARGAAEARVLLVETSSAETFASTREFYQRDGFVEEATIREYYGAGEHKVVFWQALGDA